MMDKTTLHSAIKTAAEGFIAKHKTQEILVPTFKLENGQIAAGENRKSSEIPSGDEGIEAIIDIIAEAVAQEVIKHIQDKMTLTSGNVTTASLPFTVPLDGVGGGVPGPVIVKPAELVIEAGTMTIAEGNFK